MPVCEAKQHLNIILLIYVQCNRKRRTSFYSFLSGQYRPTDKPEVRPLDPFKTGLQEYPITEMQPVAFPAESFRDAKEKVM